MRHVCDAMRSFRSGQSYIGLACVGSAGSAAAALRHVFIAAVFRRAQPPPIFWQLFSGSRARAQLPPIFWQLFSGSRARAQLPPIFWQLFSGSRATANFLAAIFMVLCQGAATAEQE